MAMMAALLARWRAWLRTPDYTYIVGARPDPFVLEWESRLAGTPVVVPEVDAFLRVLTDNMPAGRVWRVRVAQQMCDLYPFELLAEALAPQAMIIVDGRGRPVPPINRRQLLEYNFEDNGQRIPLGWERFHRHWSRAFRVRRAVSERVRTLFR